MFIFSKNKHIETHFWKQKVPRAYDQITTTQMQIQVKNLSWRKRQHEHWQWLILLCSVLLYEFPIDPYDLFTHIPHSRITDNYKIAVT